MLRGSFKNISRYSCVLPHIYLTLRQVWNIFASHYAKSWVQLVSPKKKAFNISYEIKSCFLFIKDSQPMLMVGMWLTRRFMTMKFNEISKTLQTRSSPLKLYESQIKKKLFNICILLSIFLCRDFFCLKGSFYVLIYFQRKSVIKISICAIFVFKGHLVIELCQAKAFVVFAHHLLSVGNE